MLKYIPFIILIAFLNPTTVSGQVDTLIGIDLGIKLGTDHQAISAAVCINQTTERGKANAIYNWVTHNIAYDVKALSHFPRHYDDKVAQTLKTHKAVCEGYSQVFVQLCKDAGLQAVTVDGYARDWTIDNGDEMYIPRHEWSAVRIDGKWQLVDATWGAGDIYQHISWIRKVINKILHRNRVRAKNLKFRFKYDPKYFLQDPETFRLKHMPSDPLWQLTDSAMPMAVFEAGDSAARAFNELYSKPSQTSTKLDKISKLDEKQRIFEYADRAYAFNNRYPAVLAAKNTYRALSVVEKAFTDTTVENGDLMLKDATNDLKKSLDYLKQQKKSFPEEYSKLKIKNKTKGMEAKSYIRQIKTDDKRMIATSNKHIKSAEGKYKRAKRKLDIVQKLQHTVDAGRINEIETAKVKKKDGAPELDAIRDSVAARNDRLAALNKATAIESAMLKAEVSVSALKLDSLLKSMVQEDSMLRKEAAERMGMHDSYDDEVIKWSSLFKKQKYQSTDTLFKYYFDAFDTITARYDRMLQTQVTGLGMYKSNLRSLEQYKKWNSNDAELPGRYASCAKEYLIALDSTSSEIVSYANYVKGNKKLFELLNKVCKRQIQIVAYMEKAEKSRQHFEAATLSSKKALDIKENEQQKAGVQDALDAVQEVVDKIDGMK
jgi:hypothetical protein